MKIGVFTDSFRPYTSGVVRSIELFSREFINLGHEVYIFGPDYPLLHPPREEGVYRFISVPAPTMPDFSLPIPISLHLAPTIRRIGLDIVHVHSPFLLGRLGARAARRHRLPLVFTFHTLYDQYVHYFPIAEKTSMQMVQKISRQFCNRCNLVAAPSQLVINYLQRIGVNVPIENIPTGVDLEEFKNTDKLWLQKNYGIQEDEKILLFVGRLGREKNITFLIKAFHLIESYYKNTKLVLVGKGPQEEELKKLVSQLGLQEKVIFTGVMPRNKLVHCYASSHLFVFPSMSETQGLVIGEAKATGLPTVAIRAFGPAEMVADGSDGYLTDPNLASFTGAIMEILSNDRLYNKMSKRAKENALKISSAYCADNMLSLYDKLITSKAFAPRKKNK